MHKLNSEYDKITSETLFEDLDALEKDMQERKKEIKVEKMDP